MSFILDALKKSETERQRQSGPALFEVKVAPPRAGFPLWGIVLAALLAVNAVAIGAWFLLSARPSPAPVAPAAALSPAPGAAAAAAASATSLPQALPQAEHALTPAPVAVRDASPATPRDPQLAAMDSANETRVAADVDSPRQRPLAAAPATYAPPGHVTTASIGLPTREELSGTALASLPELRLDLHVYDANPARRFVMINMRRLREGDSLPEGVRVDRITDAGAELSYRGTRFLLRHE
jgi:general secretion pathway protein B